MQASLARTSFGPSPRFAKLWCSYCTTKGTRSHRPQVFSKLDQQAMLQKVLEGDPAMMLIQLDVKEGSVNDIVNESVRSTYQVRQLYLSMEFSCSVSTCATLV